MPQPATFTAAEIALALGMKRQAVQWHLRGPRPASTRIVRGNETAAWDFCQLPAEWQKALEQKTEQAGHRNPESLVADPQTRWQPPLPLEKICDADIEMAIKNREIFQPWLARQHDCNLNADELDTAGVRDYQLTKRVKISKSYFRKLFNQYVERDGGRCNWGWLPLYLPARPRAKEVAADPVPETEAGEFEVLESHIKKNVRNPVDPTKEERKTLWEVILGKYKAMLAGGEPHRSAKRRLLHFLFARAKFLAPSPEALRKAFEQRLANGIEDGRRRNGDRAEYPLEDLERLRHSAFNKNGGRIDAAWREEYKKLSDYTKARHPYQHKCPRTLYKAVNRLKVNALLAAATGEKTLRNLVGRITADHSGAQSMVNWEVDDMTSNVQVVDLLPNQSITLFMPQIIMVLDRASRKALAWSISNSKGPTSRNVCVAVKKGIQVFGVPVVIGLENGWVFGGARNINGREDEYGQVTVAGLSSSGCAVRHFAKHNPTSKADLENFFNAIQKLMERHPGYAGRIQMLDAADDFKREERAIQKIISDRSLSAPEKLSAAKKYRYTLDEFVQMFQSIVDEYNSTPQPYGRLKDMSPDEAFQKLKIPDEQITKFSNHLRWLLDSRELVTIREGGVKYKLHGDYIEAKGAELAGRIGEEFWAVVDQLDDFMITFMSKDFATTFTVPTLPRPNRDEIRMATGSGKLAEARGRINEHCRAIKNQVADLRQKFGDTRQNLLDEIRRQPAVDGGTMPAGRRLIIDPQMAEAGELMQQQRQDIRDEIEQAEKDRRRTNRIAESTGLYVTSNGLAQLTPAQQRKLQKLKARKEESNS